MENLPTTSVQLWVEVDLGLTINVLIVAHKNAMLLSGTSKYRDIAANLWIIPSRRKGDIESHRPKIWGDFRVNVLVKKQPR